VTAFGEVLTIGQLADRFDVNYQSLYAAIVHHEVAPDVAVANLLHHKKTGKRIRRKKMHLSVEPIYA
jgi:hypothetical protein